MTTNHQFEPAPNGYMLWAIVVAFFVIICLIANNEYQDRKNKGKPVVHYDSSYSKKGVDTRFKWQ